MTRRLLVLLLSVLIGYLAGYLRDPLTTPASAQSQGQGQAPGGTPAAIPPVANPPLYPDPPQRPMHWSRDQLEKIYQARAATAKATGEAEVAPPNGPNFEGQSFRLYSVGGTFRLKHATPRLSNRAGVLSRVDDADQHEGVSDFYVYIGGGGEIVTEGVIEKRVYGSNPRNAAFSGSKVTMIAPGEFNGQPIKDGRTYTVKAGDWLAVPPNVSHWPGYNPGPDGLMYLMFKVNIGYYPNYLHF